MRYSTSEKVEIIKLVEDSDLGITKTLNELGVKRSTFYTWYYKYQRFGSDGLEYNFSRPTSFWNEISESEKARVIEIALERPELSPRELAWHITDHHDYFISESSVYRLLKRHDLITSPAYTLFTASDKFQSPTTRVNQMWQTDFTYFKIPHWGWYYLSTVLDDYSRYIISWRVCSTMMSEDVQDTLDDALEVTGLKNVKVKHKPRLLSDNGPCYVSGSLKEYISENKMTHVRGRPYHPMTQGKIERYHRTMKNIVNLEIYYSPGELEKAMSKFVDYYNHQRYHESLNNLTPSDVFYGLVPEKEDKRVKIKEETIRKRRKRNKHVFDRNKVKCYL